MIQSNKSNQKQLSNYDLQGFEFFFYEVITILEKMGKIGIFKAKKNMINDCLVD